MKIIQIIICSAVFNFLPAINSFAQQTVSDDFERHLLGPNWTDFFSGNANIVDSSDLGFPAAGFFAIAGYTGVAFQADQYSEIIISPNKIDSMLCQTFVRRRSSDNARYAFHWNPSSGGQYEIKYDGVPSAQTRILDFAASPPPLNGDTLRMEISGMTISGFHNGTLVVQATDTAFITSNPITATGVPGTAFRFSSLSFPAVYPSPVIEQWNGGDLIQTSVEESKNDLLFSVFPNPATANSAGIRFGQQLNEKAELNLLNAQGKKVLHQHIALKDGKAEISIFALPPGFYFLKITTHYNSFASKFVRL